MHPCSPAASPPSWRRTATGSPRCSTGIIGHLLPMEKVSAGIASVATKLGDSEQHALDFAAAILTTDTKRKAAAVTVKLPGPPVAGALALVALSVCAHGADKENAFEAALVDDPPLDVAVIRAK